MSAIQIIRASTAADHARVDAAFARFDLGSEAGYRRFLAAHARALPAVEAALAHRNETPPSRPRAALLAADLHALGEAVPGPLPFTIADAAAAWGALYVMEGSRLGGGMLAGAVPTGAPATYLADKHLKGEWRGFMQAFDAAAEDDGWTARAVAGAHATFALYERAARID